MKHALSDSDPTSTTRVEPYDTGGCTGGRRSTHVSRACAICRQRKSKCDGIEPLCGTCRVHGTDCIWSAEPDRRKTRDAHAAIADLKDEVKELKRQVQQVQPVTQQVEELERRVQPVPQICDMVIAELENKLRVLLSCSEEQLWPLLCCVLKASGAELQREDGAEKRSLERPFAETVSSRAIAKSQTGKLDADDMDSEDLPLSMK